MDEYKEFIDEFNDYMDAVNIQISEYNLLVKEYMRLKYECVKQNKFPWQTIKIGLIGKRRHIVAVVSKSSYKEKRKCLKIVKKYELNIQQNLIPRLHREINEMKKYLREDTDQYND